MATRNAAEIAAALDLAEAMFSGDPRVTGIDYGYAHRGGSPTAELAIRIHVEFKKAPDRCRSLELVPREIAGIPTDVIERRYRHNASSARRRGRRDGHTAPTTRALCPGTGIGSPKARAGTIGAIVFENGKPLVLSCHHVLCGPAGSVGDSLLHPAVEHGGAVPRDIVGKLFRAFPPSLWGDGAVGELAPGLSFVREQAVTGALIEDASTAAHGIEVEKVGASSRKTNGRVEGTGKYRITPGDYLIAGFQIGRTTAGDLSLPGDSGALWYRPGTNEGVGVHVASDVDEHGHAIAIACHLRRVLDTLGVSLRP